jgi:plastocyanin
MEETLFYVFGIALVLSALALSAVGLRDERFPPSRMVLVGVVGYFVVLVGATTTFGVLNAQEEQRKRDAEHAEAAATEPAPSEATTTGTTTTPTTGTGGGASQGKPTTLKLAAETNAIAYDTDQLSGKTGQVTIDFDNPSAITHDVCLESSGQQIGCSDTIAQANTSLSENLKPDAYTFYCSVDGHRQAGMEGTLTIK